jgi:hypothetical protein
MLISRTSIISGITREKELLITQDQINAWVNGEVLQNAFPDLPPEDREFFKSGITEEEWQKYIVEPASPVEEIPLGVLEGFPEGLLETKGDKIPIKTAPEYVPPSKRIYSTKNFRPDKLRQLRPVLKYLSPQIILAGGSLRTILNRAHEEVQDFDLFFTSFEAVGNLRERLVADGWTNTFSCPEEKLFSYKKGNHKLQLICETEYLGGGELISSFDVSAGCAALHEGTIFFTRQFVRSVWTKKLRMMNVSFPVATIKRLVKYAQKGYSIGLAAEDFMREIEGKTFNQDAFRHYID